MPGIFRRTWDKVTKGSDRRQELRENKRKHSLKRGERNRIVHTLAGAPKTKVKLKTTRTGRPEDHFYLARAEAKRYRRRQRNLLHMLRGAYGPEARQVALRAEINGY